MDAAYRCSICQTLPQRLVVVAMYIQRARDEGVRGLGSVVRIGNEATPTHGTTTDVVTINCCGRLQAAVGRCTKLHPEQRCARRESSPHYKKTREHVPAVLTNPTASPRHPPRCPSSRTRPRPRETTVPASRTPSSSWISLLPSVFSLLPSAVVRYARPLGTWMWLTPCQACSLWFEIGRTTPSLPPCLSLSLSPVRHVVVSSCNRAGGTVNL